MNTAVRTPPVQPTAQAAARPQWTTPQVECLETAPEVTAYAGKDEPWIKR